MAHDPSLDHDPPRDPALAAALRRLDRPLVMPDDALRARLRASVVAGLADRAAGATPDVPGLADITLRTARRILPSIALSAAAALLIAIGMTPPAPSGGAIAARGSHTTTLAVALASGAAGAGVALDDLLRADAVAWLRPRSSQ